MPDGYALPHFCSISSSMFSRCSSHSTISRLILFSVVVSRAGVKKYYFAVGSLVPCYDLNPVFLNSRGVLNPERPDCCDACLAFLLESSCQNFFPAVLFNHTLKSADNNIRTHEQISVFHGWLEHKRPAKAAIRRGIADDDLSSSALWAKVFHLLFNSHKTNCARCTESLMVYLDLRLGFFPCTTSLTEIFSTIRIGLY